MRNIPPAWQPRYAITPAVAKGLMAIEAARAAVEHTPLPPVAEAELRHHARLRSAHYSTRIEGNRLTLAEAERAIAREAADLQGREHDVGKVRNRRGFVLYRTGETFRLPAAFV